MKKLTPEALVELARVCLRSPWIAAPQWDKEKKQWVSIHPRGTSTSSCGVPDFSGIPKTEADIKPHQRLMWQRCKRCNLIRPWGGCARNSIRYTKVYNPGGRR